MLEAHAALVSALRGLNFDNTAVRTLAVDPQLGGPVRQVRGAHVVRVEPTRLKSPELVATSEALGLLGLPLGSGGAEAADAGDDADDDADADAALLDPERLPLAIRSDLAAYLSGNEQLPGAEPFAAAYCGHQFGRFAGQLGDGAVISLGEIVSCGGGAVGSELLGGEEEGGGGGSNGDPHHVLSVNRFWATSAEAVAPHLPPDARVAYLADPTGMGAASASKG